MEGAVGQEREEPCAEAPKAVLAGASSSRKGTGWRGVSVEPFDPGRHTQGIVRIVRRSEAHPDYPYPPPRGTAALKDGNAHGWVLSGGAFGHWVALYREAVVGSARLDAPGPYLVDFIAGIPDVRFAELQRVVVDPEARGKGVGRALVSEALAHARARRLGVMLAVFDYLPVARQLYESVGFTSQGSFHGPNGLTHVLALLDP